MRYLICKRAGEGCDYTIGCGMVYEFFDFEGSLQDAVMHFTPKIIHPDGEDERCTLFGENPLQEVWIVPADVAVSLDLGSLRSEIEGRILSAKKAAAEAAERELYESLRKKYQDRS